jgi:hypothetical protein
MQPVSITVSSSGMTGCSLHVCMQGEKVLMMCCFHIQVKDLSSGNACYIALPLGGRGPCRVCGHGVSCAAD